jgi:hypothetical protein
LSWSNSKSCFNIFIIWFTAIWLSNQRHCP